ncbi:MAG: hypothetical protein ACP5QO_08900 [Clostridia bacterium]
MQEADREDLFHPYEASVLAEVARHRTEHDMPQRVLDRLSAPARFLDRLAGRIPALERLTERIRAGVEDAQDRITEVAARETDLSRTRNYCWRQGVSVHTWDQVGELPMAVQDQLSRDLPKWWVYGAVEGGTVGLVQGLTDIAVIPWLAMAAADATATLWMGAREAVLQATCYGFDPSDPEMKPHLMAAMVPPVDWDRTRYLGMKAVLSHPRVAQRVLTELWTRRMTVMLTDKEAMVWLPLAGAVMNAGLNAAYLFGIRQSARDYFRMLRLAQRYGPDAVINRVETLSERPREIPITEIPAGAEA